jgi:hypothetical protein
VGIIRPSVGKLHPARAKNPKKPGFFALAGLRYGPDIFLKAEAKKCLYKFGLTATAEPWASPKPTRGGGPWTRNNRGYLPAWSRSKFSCTMGVAMFFRQAIISFLIMVCSPENGQRCWNISDNFLSSSTPASLPRTFQTIQR